MNLPSLYTTNKAGKKQIWKISVINEKKHSRTITEYGVIGGKIVVNERLTDSGKNIGRANETTHYEQALKEATSKWNLKKSGGYTENSGSSSKKKSPTKKKSSSSEMVKLIKKLTVSQTPLLPMLALDYHKRGKDIDFPCFVQPKIDGARAIYRQGDFYSRMGNVFPKLPHILSELSKVDLNLDGELYSYDLSFPEMMGALKKVKADSKKLIYLVYDYIPSGSKAKDGYELRYSTLKDTLSKIKSKYIVLIPTEICKGKNDIEKFHKKYLSQGYEGLIIRNFKGPYELKHRSKNLQKYKDFKDDEFEITDAAEGKGKEKGLVVWIVKTKQGKTFAARPMGTHEERRKLFIDYKKYIGKMLTVKYFELSPSGIPRFPIGISIRDYE